MVKAVPRNYTDEFKLEAVKLVQEIGVIDTTRRLNILESTLGNWVTAWQKQTLFKDGHPKAQPPVGSVAALQAEINRLRRENVNGGFKNEVQF